MIKPLILTTAAAEEISFAFAVVFVDAKKNIAVMMFYWLNELAFLF